MSYKIAQLSLTPGRRSQTVSDVYLAQPDSIKEELAGKLFILIEIERNNSDSLKIINFLIDNINYNYYQNEKIYLREKISSLKVEHIFEASLAKTNKNLIEYFDKEKIKIDPNIINVTTGILHENMIHFATVGKNKAFLVYKSAAKNVSDEGEYKIIDLASDKGGKNKSDIGSGKFFSNVISGVIPEKGIFLFANEALPEYISSKQLTQIITTLPPLSAVEQMKSMLTKINSYVSFLGIIIRSTTTEKPEERREPTIVTTNESIDTLNRTEDSTEKLLAPTGLVNTKKFWGNFTQIFGSRKKKSDFTEGKASLQDKIFMKKKRFLFLGSIFNYIKTALIHLINLLFFLFKSFSSKERFLALFSGGKQAIINIFAQTKFFFTNLNRKNKAILLVAVACLIILPISLLYKNQQQQAEISSQSYIDLVAQIEQKQNQIDGFMLYNNETGAKDVLKEIESLLKTFPQKTEEQKNKYNEINNKTNELLFKIRKIVRIDNAEELANFGTANSNANPKNLVYLADSGKIYAADSAQKTFYILDINSKTSTAMAGLSQPLNDVAYPMLTKDKKIYYFNQNNFIELDTTKDGITELPVKLPTDAQNIASANIYNNKIYLLDAKENKIFKTEKSGASFADPQSWLAENIDLSKTVDLAIDGNIYALTTDGQIIKMLKGKLQNFNLDAVDPAIEQATKLFMDSDQKFIYVLEPSKQRIVVFNKEGKYQTQYQSDQWQNLKDLAVDEKNKTIYILNNASVLKFTASHIK